MATPEPSSRGFDIHAGVSVSPHDREGRERLLRYCARPLLSLERLSVLEDGRVAYRIKSPRGRQTHRVMSPTQFLARLCALIPPPRHPLPLHLLGHQGGEAVQTERDLSAERAALLAACPLLGGLAVAGDSVVLEDPVSYLELLSVLRSPECQLVVEWPEGAPLKLRARWS